MLTPSDSTPAFNIADRDVGGGAPCFIVGEIAQAHDGSLGTAHAYIDAVAKAGASAIKFQTHLADAESTPAEPWRVRFSPQDETRYGYWKRMEFTEAQWRGLAAHARESGLVFMSSPFSPEAVDLLDRVGMPAWKIGAGEITNHPMIQRAARTGRPVLLSSGLASYDDLDEAVALVRAAGAPVGVFQCTSAYPCPPEELGLNVLAELRDRYGCPVGLSDHSAKTYAGLAAVTLGAKLLEVHVVFSRECFGPDASSSLTTTELRDLVDGIRFIEKALAHPVDKNAAAARLENTRRVFGKSIVAARTLSPGSVLTEADVRLKKPGTGVPAKRLPELIGRRLRVQIDRDALLREEDLE